MEEPPRGQASAVLAALDDLDDRALFAVMVRAQGLLLDRPIAPPSSVPLAVEIVDGEEDRLLASYRALAPSARQRLLAHAAQILRVSPRAIAPLPPTVRPAVAV